VIPPPGLDAAAASLDRAEAALSAAFAPDHQSIGAVLTGKAMLAGARGDDAQAQALLERSLAIAEHAHGLDHPRLVPTPVNLSALAANLGARATARRHTQRAVSILERAYGEYDIRVAREVEHLANLLASNGDGERAQQRLDQAYEARRRRVGDNDPSLTNNWLARAKIFVEAARWAQADAALDRAEALAPTGAQRATIQLTRAESLWRRDRRRAAVKEAKRARESLGDAPLERGLHDAIDDWFDKH
jgi:tetratricopeptide (TPR) repeat protein